MRILHYTLGFSPVRSGGLVEYATDVMTEESAQGHMVIALYPGNLNFIKRTPYIRKTNSKKYNFKVFELINSLPLPLFGGIRKPHDFMEKMSILTFKDFLANIHPDVIHVHTLMGLPIEFFISAKKLGIKIVYTTHDYFGLAPEPNFYDGNASYDCSDTVANWIAASQGSYSTKKLRVFQLRIYPVLKRIMRAVKMSRSQRKTTVNYQSSHVPVNEYEKLRQYYRRMFFMVDEFHFNSNLTRKVFESVLGCRLPGNTISITNNVVSNIENKSMKKTVSSKTRIAYIGPNLAYKGFNDFIELTKRLPESKYSFFTYGYEPERVFENVIQKGRYKSDELEQLYSKIDILIVPSEWKETFGLIVLEALANKTPAYVSRNVGAKDLLEQKFIFNDLDDLVRKIENDEWKSKRFPQVKSIKEHVGELINFYS